MHYASEVDNPGRKFALKRVIVMDELSEEAVMREVSNWESIPDHENITKFHGYTTTYGDNDAKVYLILCELCPDGTLVDFISKYDMKLEEPQILYVMDHIVKGIIHMHSMNPPLAH